jgi:uncharacterized membrane protein YhaH (DUF805 family)
MEWMILPFKRYADFSGRSRRKEYWMFQLFNVLIVVALVAIIIAGAPEMNSSPYSDVTVAEEPGVLFSVGIGLAVLYWLISFIPGLAVFVRRLHDTGRSGWWWFISFIPFGSIVLLVFMCIEGDGYENAYGPDPKDEGGDAFYRETFR